MTKAKKLDSHCDNQPWNQSKYQSTKVQKICKNYGQTNKLNLIFVTILYHEYITITRQRSL